MAITGTGRVSEVKMPSEQQASPALRPTINSRFNRVPINLSQLVGTEFEAPDRCHIVLELLDAARPDQRRGHPRVAQHPGQSHLGQRLAASLRNLVQRPNARKILVGDRIWIQRLSLRRKPGWTGSRSRRAERGSSGTPLTSSPQ
jgi:hypothetical protein